MRIAILGAGFTGLTAGLRLLQAGHSVTIFEKEDSVGGLAGGFKRKNWDWTLEKAYHHWFTNDFNALNLSKELNHKVIIKRPQTNVFVNNQILPLDSPTALLTFPSLPLIDRLRTGLITLYLKLTNNYQSLEKYQALAWLRKYMGEKSTKLIWEPLFQGKFGKYKESISLTWFWARIKKRTPKLAYPEGGFLNFAERLAEEVKNLGGGILLKTEVYRLQSTVNSLQLTVYSKNTKAVDNKPLAFDRIISTLPSPVFTKITPNLPKNYINQINSIDHLFAQNLILILKKPFMGNTYWLNITSKEFPFLVLAEHTNFMDSSHYGNEHILYIGNYLPKDHPYLKLSAKELLKVFDPFLKQINPDYSLQTIDYSLFTSPFAQPIVTTNYSEKIPDFQTPIKNLFIANMDMVYPWDRGTNYAIEIGNRVASLL